MLSLLEAEPNGRTSLSRRELLRVGGVGMLGLSLPALLQSQSAAELSFDRGPMFGRAKNLIFVFLAGGPSQYETFDPKPDAPSEIRGTFRPIATNVPGIDFCELLPRVARIADKLAVCRSFATDNPEHESGGYHVNTGHKYTGPNSRSLQPTDWPTMSSIIKMFRPSESIPFSTVTLPEPVMANPNVVLPGHNGGFLGPRWDPQMFTCDPAEAGFAIEGLAPPAEVPLLRLSGRRDLLAQLDHHSRSIAEAASVAAHDRLTRESLDVVLSGRARNAFALDREAAALRDRYGRAKWGQSLLLARRLIETGVRMVFVNWPREPGDLSANNPLWDTHAQNDVRMKDFLCPQFDLGFSALIDDLDQRGLLAETLVVAIGEMGRTPKFNPWGGRDHWGNVFPFVMAGAGIAAAQVYGSSDRNGSYPASHRVNPGDLTATIFHLLGINHEVTFPDRTGRPLRATEGEPIHALLGDKPATRERSEPGGEVPATAFFSTAPLVFTRFESPAALHPIDKRVRGWQAEPLWNADAGDGFDVRLAESPEQPGGRHVAIGYGLSSGRGRGLIVQGTRAMLVQEVFNPRPGEYAFTVAASGGDPEDVAYYRDVWCRHFTCRMIIFGYADNTRDPRKIVEFTSQTIQPPALESSATKAATYTVATRLDSQNNGANQLGFGVGVALIVEKTSADALDLSKPGLQGRAFVRVTHARVDFTGVA